MSIQTSHNVNYSPTWDAMAECVRQLQESESRSRGLCVRLEYSRKRKEGDDPFPGVEILREKGLFSETQKLAKYPISLQLDHPGGIRDNEFLL